MEEEWIYHELQESSLCGVHCLNNLLQGSYFTAVDLSEIARELDEKERQHMLEAGTETEEVIQYLAEDSSNVDNTGNFSVDVLRVAIERSHGLRLVSSRSQEVTSTPDGAVTEGYICNKSSHWFAIRKLYGKWFRIDSLEERPIEVGEFYLDATIAQLQVEGYSVFIVKGNLPEPLYIPDEEQEGATWYSYRELQQTNGGTSTMGNDEDADLQRALQTSTKEYSTAMGQSGQVSSRMVGLYEIIPDEPPADSPEVCQAEFRLGNNLSFERRFRIFDSAAHLFHFISKELEGKGDVGKEFALFTPSGENLAYDEIVASGATIEDLGFGGNTVVYVRLKSGS